MRIARHHDALLVPVWFSGRNRLRYYLAARIRKELDFGSARGVPEIARQDHWSIGKPSLLMSCGTFPGGAPNELSARSTYELSREHGMASVAGQCAAPNIAGLKQPRPVGPFSLGEKLEARSVDAEWPATLHLGRGPKR
jgi:hypothetical protein